MEGKKFQKTIENFVCEHCEKIVEGNGYTNHCPECLWSKHVDVDPGDRRAECGGMMKPIGLDKKGEVFSVIQKCIKCEHQRKNKLVKGDSFEAACSLF
ncbi:hypothetical protein A2442_03470 [Candidatus Campbellbacteria bacterium RIFOXYC2_FULL_35_25]|uniref:RNHCP domain-containing protein n=1 Tax=Candidatus Campbellbacteria bacterium RIFOXYC2_FULL_35_25 TaxID=1797582 RepID=A0A1F5EI87_9BACT|nr:MAG: hypothetical protein A2442_03470 [Candidatus Campbellbacteria bacterium RIFOXYC2_FULL_35_25]